jgi:uncharacterized protein (UPF0147 family)
MLRAYCKPDIERSARTCRRAAAGSKECLMQQKMQLSVGCAKALEELKKK